MIGIHLRYAEERITAEVAGTMFPTTTAADDILRFASLDFTDYRERIWNLETAYPSVGEEEVKSAVELLSVVDSLSFAFVNAQLKNATATDYDTLINILLEPVWAQIVLRNAFLVAFDNAEQLTQEEKYHRLISIYPQIAEMYFSMRWIDNCIEFNLNNVTEMMLLELQLYFRQKRMRIARCLCCGEYFIPATKKETLYCNRIWKGRTCKNIGPNLMRYRKMEQDRALAVYENVRRTLFERVNRYESAAESERGRLQEMNKYDYWKWIDNAKGLRENYKKGNISSADFLRAIDTYNLLDSYIVEMTDSEAQESQYMRRVKADINFDPWLFYQPMMTLDLSANTPVWEVTSSDKRLETEREGDGTLIEKYLKK